MMKCFTVILVFLSVIIFALPGNAQCPIYQHNAFTNFNSSSNPGTATSLWLNIHTKISGELVSNGQGVLFTGGTITLTGVTSTPAVTNLPIPDGLIIADNTVSAPVTSFDAVHNRWITKVPLNYSSSDIFISGGIFNSSTGYVAGGGKHSDVSGYFYSNVLPSFSSSWFYGLACYQPTFSYANVAPSDSVLAVVKSGKKAGTPISRIGDLVAGGSGGGGSNYTGSNSSTDNYEACYSDDNPLPVELSSFSVNVIGKDIQLNWSTKTEKNSDKFVIEKNNTLSWEEIGSVKASVLSNSTKYYSFQDKNLQSGKYQYRLKMIDNDGTFQYSSVIEAVVEVPKEYSLMQNYPNPFNPSTVINYSIPQDGKVTLKVFDITGRELAILVSENQKAGHYSVEFDARRISSGVYFYSLGSGSFIAVKKLTIIK